MMLPLWSRPALGMEWVTDEWAIVRRVLAMNFPQFCLELMNDYTAREIVDCWETLPIVCRAKEPRGPSSTKSARANDKWWVGRWRLGRR